MSKKINNKNAREKALLEEAYGSVYNESPIQHKFSKKYRDKYHDEFKDHIKLRKGTLGAKYPPGKEYKDEIQKKIDQGWEIEDEQNPDADTYDKQGEENPFAVTADARDEEEEYTAEQHAKGIKMAIEALGFIEAELPTDYEENINVNELKGAHDHLSKALHWLLDETDVDYIMGREEVQEYDMDLDPQGRREADPREY